MTCDNIYKHQLEDPILEIVRKWIGVDHHAPDQTALRGQSRDVQRFAEIFDTLKIAEDGVLEQEIQTFAGKRRRILVPLTLREAVFNHSHRTTKEFCNTIMKLLLQKLGVKHALAPVANPQSNLVERWHKTMEETLRTVIQGQETEWPKYLPACIQHPCS